MKKIILVLLLLSLALFSFSENRDQKGKKTGTTFPMDENGRIVFTEIIEISNVTKDMLYARAYEWFAKAFHSAQNVIQMQDKENGIIIGKGAIDNVDVTANLGMVAITGNVKFTISVYLKDGKYKYEITDFVHEAMANWSTGVRPANGGALENEKADCGKATITTKKWESIKLRVKISILDLVKSLKKAMETEPAGDDW